MRSSFLLTAVLCFSLSSPCLKADDGDATEKPADPGPNWGTLPLQFIYDGDPPEPEQIKPIRGAALCGRFKIIDEKLLVDRKTKGIANVVFTLNQKRRDLPKQLPAIVQKLAEKKVRMTNKNCRFEPRVAAMWIEQTLELGNNDPDVHNMLFNVRYNKPFNEVMQPGTASEKTFTRAERLPACGVSCGIHPFMKGWFVLKDHPYSAVSSRTGQAKIAHLPVGTWEFQLWHEEAGYLSTIEINGKPATGEKGIYKWEIGSGENGPLRIVVKPAAFGIVKKPAGGK